MWKQRVGISLKRTPYDVPIPHVIRLLRDSGFDAVSPLWGTTVDIGEICSTARQCGMLIESLHAPFGKTADLWSRDPAIYEPAVEIVLRALEDCVRYEIPLAVMHAWIGHEYTFDGSDLYFENFDRIVAYASGHGIKIAFENTEGEEYLSALLAHYKGNEMVGFCWDSGHEMCYNHSQDLLAKYGDRLLVTHLNDNLGISSFDGKITHLDDLHLLPYDGIADWDHNVQRLKSARPLQSLNFELLTTSKPGRHDNDQYAQMPLEQYFALAYQRACRIAYNYSL